MGKISDRITGTIEDWRVRWGKALQDFLASVITFGIEILLNVIGKVASIKLKPFIELMEQSGEVPEELLPVLQELKEPKGQVAAMFAQTAGGSILGGAIGKMIDAMFNPLGYWMYRLRPNLMPDLTQTMALWLRGHIKEEDLPLFLASQGFSEKLVPFFKDLYNIRLDPVTITSIWLRDKAKYEKLWQDLEHQGWTPNRIEVIKELAKIIPPLADMVRFADFSAFDPEVIARWRQFYDAPNWIADPFALIGITNEAPRDWANKYWFSHWRQPGRFELGEMYRRALLGKPLIGAEEIGETGGEGEAEATIKLAYRTMGYSSFWQDALLQLVREVPTRVDVRRWWDMRTIDETELRSIYQRRGYFGKDLENYVLWTKVYVAFPDLVARFKNGWIAEADAKSELLALGMPPERVEEMWQTKFKAVQHEGISETKKLNESVIIKAYKDDKITRSECINLLIRDRNYSPEDAAFVVDVKVSALGSPETYLEFLEIIEKHRKAHGLDANIPSPDLIEADKAVKQAENTLRQVETKERDDITLAEAKRALEDAKIAYHQLLA